MLRLDIPITKVDAAQRLVYGVATAEVPDRSGEICDYASTKPMYEKWSEGIRTSTNGRSHGNLRAMHGAVAAGKVTALAFNDAAKQIEICAKVVDDAEWQKVAEGVYTGFSQGGAYAKRWTDATGATRYTAEPHEISLVDLPCLAEAHFEMIKADGSHEWRRFAPPDDLSKGEIAKAARVQALHDDAVALGATCAAVKVLAAPDPAQGIIKGIGDDLAKRFDALTETLGKALADLSMRLKAIEEQPQPLPFAVQPRAVAKQDDGADGALDALLADPGALSLLAIKLAQQRTR